MSLHALRLMIESSSSQDWSKIDKPPMLPRFYASGSSGRGIELDVAYHDSLLTHVDDVDVQLAYGMDADYTATGEEPRQRRSFDWAEGFLHSEGTAVKVHTLYRGSVVDEAWVVSFDGAWLPMPGYIDRAGDSELVKGFSGRSLAIARLLHSIDYPSDGREAERLMESSGLPIID